KRHEDRSKFVPINELKIGEYQTAYGEVLARGARKSWFTKSRVFETALGDDTGQISCVWFNQPYLEKYFKPGSKVVLYGRVDRFKNRLQMVSPEYELIEKNDESLNINRIVPIYGLTKGISHRFLRKVIFGCLDEHASSLRDVLPEKLRNKYSFTHISQCIRSIHFPANWEEQTQAQNRASFEEFFLFQTSVILRRMSIVQKEGFSHTIKKDLIPKYGLSFGFPLTRAQDRSIEEVAQDMKKTTPMLRLLQGDVGSGKTLVAFFGCLVSFANGYQSAVMAPTEILAQQHYANFNRLIIKGGFPKVRVGLLVSSQPKAERTKVLSELKDGLLDVVIGTHALLEQTVIFKNLSYVVIDEQHKFGVKQRALLTSKGKNPDVLVMTATPIPRTLCLTLYGDLDVSVLDERPAGRGTVQTYQFPSEQAPHVYARLREWIRKGTQAYIVYPIVEESEKLDLKAATEMYDYFANQEFKDLRVGLLHGQMDKKETQNVMEMFKDQKIDILVTTTVLEVGVDVANANVMVIEHAQRFGLSQLHQLRGRIGRGKKNAICLLLTDSLTPEGRCRIDAIVSTTDGFKIAQEDLKIRGPGHYFGKFQHGLNELRMADPVTQLHVLEDARKEAVEMLNADPKLRHPDHGLIIELIQKRYPEYLSLVFAA
ncbi:MAG: ATP-dependent DNA helicase RecG, partial [Candidatus Omnitrophica bacterium]|nr:ATP-dependent DNA helicase RecG [Candidatus Omnitrophota bacterium]